MDKDFEQELVNGDYDEKTGKIIIVDNIDVSKCEFLIITNDKHLCRCIKSDLFGGIEFVENAKKGNCEDNPNCYYKQLQQEKQSSQESRDTSIKEFNRAEELNTLLKHKEQECENLKEKNQYLINTYCHFKNETKKYKKAVHKYKVVFQDKIERLHLSRREFLKEINSISKRIACNNEDFKNALSNFNNAIQVINNEDRYKQALDEIEKYLDAQQKYFDGEDYHNLLDIINKAKEQ